MQSGVPHAKDDESKKSPYHFGSKRSACRLPTWVYQIRGEAFTYHFDVLNTLEDPSLAGRYRTRRNRSYQRKGACYRITRYSSKISHLK